jgi:hypothetical protein
VVCFLKEIEAKGFASFNYIRSLKRYIKEKIQSGLLSWY